jgi:hypothetical protein
MHMHMRLLIQLRPCLYSICVLADKIRWLGFTSYTTRDVLATLHNSAMLGPSHAQTQMHAVRR